MEGPSNSERQLAAELAAANKALKLEIAERERAMAAVQASEEKLRAISDGALDALVMIDPEGNVVHWNPAAERMFGFRQEEIIGRNAHEMLAPVRFRERAMAGLREFAVSGQGPAVGKVMELDALRKDGSEFAIEIAVAPIHVEGRWRAAAIIRDVTERKLTQEKLCREQQNLQCLLEMYERDRKLTAFDIHDGLSQSLTAALMQLERGVLDVEARRPEDVPESLGQAVRLLRESLKEARRLMGGLRPAILDELGLRAAIDHLVCERQEEGGCQIEYVEDVQFGRLAPPLETAIFRLVQEALANALQHSRSQKVRIRLTQLQSRLTVEVQDWGAGFDLSQTAQNRFGLEGIRLRAELFGGEVRIESAAGRGTRVAVELPIVEQTDDREDP